MEHVPADALAWRATATLSWLSAAYQLQLDTCSWLRMCEDIRMSYVGILSDVRLLLLISWLAWALGVGSCQAIQLEAVSCAQHQLFVFRLWHVAKAAGSVAAAPLCAAPVTGCFGPWHKGPAASAGHALNQANLCPLLDEQCLKPGSWLGGFGSGCPLEAPSRFSWLLEHRCAYILHRLCGLFKFKLPLKTSYYITSCILQPARAED